MGCKGNGGAGRERWESRMAGMQERIGRWGCRGRQRERTEAFAPTGNRAFDEYREETLRRLEDEASEFSSFLDRLRHAKDKAEFDQFMAERRDRPAPQPQGPAGQPG